MMGKINQTGAVMSGLKSRNKGKGYEYEIAKELHHQLGLTFQRELEQTREKNLGDLYTDDCDFPFVIECKRRKTGVDPKWWDQVCIAAEQAGKMPALFYRLDRQQTRVRLPVQAMTYLAFFIMSGDLAEKHDWRYACEMDIDTFCYVAREMLANG
jgi:hypothetical protein